MGLNCQNQRLEIQKLNQIWSFKQWAVSVICHPKNQNIPTSHMNIRLFCILNKNKQIKDWWIGGGYD